MKFTHHGKRITLQGVKQETAKCPPISAGKLKGLLRRNAIACCLQLKVELATQEAQQEEEQTVCSLSDLTMDGITPEIQTVITKYSHLFQEPSALPPTRQCDHNIALLPGAQPVSVRPYRYAPSQKSEIEKQC